MSQPLLFKYSKYLRNVKFFTHRQVAIIMTLLEFKSLQGNGVYTVQKLSEETGIRKNLLYTELKKLPFIFKNQKGAIEINLEKLDRFIEEKKSQIETKSQNDTPKVSKRDLGSLKIRPEKSQNETCEVSKRDFKNLSKPNGDKSQTAPLDSNIQTLITDSNFQTLITDTNKEACDRKAEDSDFEEKKEKLKEFREKVKEEIKESSGSKEDKEDKPVTDAHIRATVERIKEAFKTEYVKRFNKPALISANSVNKIFKDLKESCSTLQELKEAETHLIKKIPDFFSLTDEWIRKKGYSFFAFSWRIGDLLSEPVKPKYCGSYTNKEFSLTEAMPW